MSDFAVMRWNINMSDSYPSNLFQWLSNFWFGTENNRRITFVLTQNTFQLDRFGYVNLPKMTPKHLLDQPISNTFSNICMNTSSNECCNPPIKKKNIKKKDSESVFFFSVWQTKKNIKIYVNHFTADIKLKKGNGSAVCNCSLYQRPQPLCQICLFCFGQGQSFAWICIW